MSLKEKLNLFRRKIKIIFRLFFGKHDKEYFVSECEQHLSFTKQCEKNNNQVMICFRIGIPNNMDIQAIVSKIKLILNETMQKIFNKYVINQQLEINKTIEELVEKMWYFKPDSN